MTIHSTWPMQFFTDELPDEFGFMILPPIEDRPQAMIRLMGSGWFIPADTEHPEEAIKFLDYLVSEDVIPLWSRAPSCCPLWPVSTIADWIFGPYTGTSPTWLQLGTEI